MEYSATERNGFATTWMDVEGIMFSEITHTKKAKNCMLSFICGI